MKASAYITAVFILISFITSGQNSRDDIRSDFALYNKRQALDKDIRENVIARAFSQALNADNEYRFESACNAITQFMIRSAEVEKGFATLFAGYDSLQYETKRAFLESVYGIYPNKYDREIKNIFQKETNPKLFAICAAYLLRADSSVDNANTIKIRMVEQFPNYDTLDLLTELEKYINYDATNAKKPIPSIPDLFAHQQTCGKKIVYSFQRWNRNYPGIAIVQNADGSFARHPDGRLMVFEQLARSAADLPYFITDGSTPQGIYSIQTTAVVHNNLIGPTPTLQMIMPYEDSLQKYFLDGWDSTQNPLISYLQLLPGSWRKYEPMTEAYYAGKIGRSEIIAHGSTIDPEYFKDEPFYPLTPTMGCLCAKEIWNVTNGKLLVSEQFNLYSAFVSTPGRKGYLYVINVDDQMKAVTRAEVEKWVGEFERRRSRTDEVRGRK